MASQVLLVISGVVSLMVFGAAYYLVFPLFLNIQQHPSADCLASANCMTIFDRTYNTVFIAFEIVIGGIFFSMFMRATRRDQTESYSSSSSFEGF
jgi:hypothetical protein